MSLVKFDAISPNEISSALTTKSVEDLQIAPGDETELEIRAIHVLPVKEQPDPSRGWIKSESFKLFCIGIAWETRHL